MKGAKTVRARALEIERTGMRTVSSRTMQSVNRDVLLCSRKIMLMAPHKLNIKPGVNLELWDIISSGQYRGLGFYVNIQEVPAF